MNIFSTAIPPACPADIITWAEANIKVDGHSFDASRTPQLVEPIRAMADAGTRIGTLIKPVQVGGSTAGEVVLAYWAAFGNGLIQFNWENDLKATNRWHDRILPALESCRDIKRTGHRFEELICEARYINTTVRCQGVFREDALDSDTVPLQINEEIHGWKPGFLSKARRRQTQVWNSKAFDISNASQVGDQLHAAYEDGTAEVWEINCPKCDGWHKMQFRWNPDRPGEGGLRWDADGCKLADGRFNYNKLAETIRYQMPCGHEVRDIAAERRQLRGRYRVTNEGAHVSHRSWTFDAVSCDSINWLRLVQEWHAAVRGLKTGDTEQMHRFVTERECRFYSDEAIPYRGAVVVSAGITKSRDGLPNRAARLWAADAQKGYRSKGELSHYWLVIRDVLENCDSRLVFEGSIQTDTDLIAMLEEHGCQPRCGVIDATWDTKRLMEFCYRNGFNATLGSAKQEWFAHPDKIRRFYSAPKPIHGELNVPPRFNYTATAAGWTPAVDEPQVWFYNKAGLLSNLDFLRYHEELVRQADANAPAWHFIKYEVPADVSEDYKLQIDSWERRASTRGRAREHIEEWRQTRPADHMRLCEGYIAMLMEMEGFIGNRLAGLGLKPAAQEP